jgi:sulfur-carrier protein
MLKILYFSSLVDRLGCASEQLPLPGHVLDVRGLVRALQERGGVWEEVFGRGVVRVTVNKQFAELATAVKDGDEVAFIPAS